MSEDRDEQVLGEEYEAAKDAKWEMIELPFEDDTVARCKYCGILLDDYNLLEIGYCSSECEREANV